MAYNNNEVLKDLQGNTIPQYYNPVTDSYEPLEGSDGANKVVILDANGSEIVSTQVVQPILDKLDQLTGTALAEENRKVFEDYDPLKQYYVGNKVAYEGSSYYVIAEPPVGTLPTNPLYFLLIAEKGDQGVQGIQGDNGRGIVSVVRTSGDGSAGTTDTYTITYTDETTSLFYVYNGADGQGTGDMLKSQYDTNDDGKVNSADTADSVPWSGVTNKPVLSTVATSGSYTDLSNKPTIPDTSGLMPKSGGVLEDYTEETNTTTGTINLSLGNVFTHTLSANTTYSITNAVSGVAHSFTLIITQPATPMTLTFPESVKWQGGEIPDLTTASKTYVLTFMTVDGGTTWLGMFGGMF